MSEHNPFTTDTIAAISTAVSEAGIGIIRISGPDAIAVGDRVCMLAPKGLKKLRDATSHTIHYGYVMDGPAVIDEVLVSVFHAPRSFTAEDTVEINCHGGVYALNRCLDVVLRCGARIAEPGEFTKRAFLNGRIDLTQAEAVMDVIQAKSELSLKTSVSQLRGSLHQKISGLRSEMLHDAAYIEAALDDPEHYDMEGFPQQLQEKNKDWMLRIDQLIDTARSGRLIRERIQTVIIGKPNAGKSSLLNFLADEELAIVTDIPGTTRDILTQTIRIGDIILNIADTAGIRHARDEVEKIGIERALSRAEESDLVLYVADSSLPVDEWDLKILNTLREKPLIVLLNKSDLPPALDESKMRELIGPEGTILNISATSGTGINQLKETIKEMFFRGRIDFNDEAMITNIRHQQCLQRTKASLMLLEEGLEAGMPEDLCCIDLMDAISSLGEITGQTMREDLISEIFRSFCMGK